MSQTTLGAILFFGIFPALVLLAWWLDRVWPSNWEREHTSDGKSATPDEPGPKE
jgi:hypothetical protein